MRKVRSRFLLSAAVTIAVVVAGCGSTSHVGGSSATTTSEPATTAEPSSTAQPTTTTVPVPTESQLRSALLTAAELGAPFTLDTSTGSGNTEAGGCPGLANDINDTSTTPGQVGASVDFTAGHTGPFVTQVLLAEPTSTFDASLKETKDNLASCKELTLTSDGETLRFDLTPFNFAEGATGARLDGTYQGIQLNGYFAVQPISRNVAMLFLFFQIGSGSSQVASYIYTMGVDKAKRAFPSS